MAMWAQRLHVVLEDLQKRAKESFTTGWMLPVFGIAEYFFRIVQPPWEEPW
jgi:hypothetical protein